MCNNSPVRQFIVDAVDQFNQHRTSSSLGNRGAYIGASDIAASFGCERRVILNKIHPDSPLAEDAWRLERGHWIEEGIANAIKSRIKTTITGMSMSFITDSGTPVAVHPDLVVLGQNKVVLFEIKSVKEIPDTPRIEHQTQLNMQLSALQKYWTDPVFAVGNEPPCSFPELVRQQFNEKIGDERQYPIEGYIVYASFEAVKVSDAQRPQAAMLQVMLNKADRLWELKNGTGEPTTAKGIYPLCDYCRHCGNCPAFASLEIPSLKGVIEELVEAKESAKLASEREKHLTDKLKKFGSNPNVLGKWLSAGSDKIKVTQVEGRTSLDTAKLTDLLVREHGFTVEAVESLLEASSAKGQSYLRLTISKAKDYISAQNAAAA
jgi:hypothetical protein